MRKAHGKNDIRMSKAKRPLRAVAIVMLLALILSLLPLYAAARYSYAGVDDYRYGLTTHAVWEETRSFPQTVAEAWRVAERTYTEWQGSFAAIFLMALQPGIFDSGLYGLSTVILLTVLVLSILYFGITACAVALRADGETATCVAALLAIACVQFVPSPVESYYWFNGGVYYTFFFSLSLIAAALFIRRYRKRTLAQCILLPLTMLLLGLGNLVTGLLSCALLFCYAVFCLTRKARDPLLWVTAALLAAAFAANVFSPGNGVRQAENLDRARGAIPAILAALKDACRYAGTWCLTPAAPLMLLPVPLYWRLADRTNLRFGFPALLTVFSLLLLAVGFTPNEYALGFPGETRILDIQYYQFVLLLALNVFWYTGWAKRRLRLSERTRRSASIWVPAIAMAIAAAVMVGTRNMACASAALMQVNGKAQSYADTWERRLTTLCEPARRDVVLPKCESQPPLLCMVDIAPSETDPFYFYNEQLAAYFGKASVLREP